MKKSLLTSEGPEIPIFEVIHTDLLTGTVFFIAGLVLLIYHLRKGYDGPHQGWIFRFNHHFKFRMLIAILLLGGLILVMKYFRAF